jgi:hypothetical protein
LNEVGKRRNMEEIKVGDLRTKYPGATSSHVCWVLRWSELKNKIKIVSKKNKK